MGNIVVPQPSMVVHSHDVPGWKYAMYNSWFLKADEDMQHIADWTTSVAQGAPGGRLRCLIFNCHGSCGSAKLSNNARLNESVAGKFAQMKGRVNHIIIVACTVIGANAGSNATFWSDPGVKLCYALARNTGARVYASNEYQSVNLFGTLFGGTGDIDEFEGSILHMTPSGQSSWLPSNQSLSLMLKSL
jgi:hypothetical protein